MKYLILFLLFSSCSRTPKEISIETGKLVSRSKGCLGCHSTDGINGIGPSWTGLYGRDVILTSGETIQVNKTYIIDSIKEPNKQVVKGYNPIMPAYNLNNEELESVIIYIESLK